MMTVDEQRLVQVKRARSVCSALCKSSASHYHPLSYQLPSHAGFHISSTKSWFLSHVSLLLPFPTILFACVSVTFNSKTMFKYEERKDALINYDNNWAKEVSKNHLSVKLVFSKFTRQWSEPRRTVPLYGMHASTEWLFPVPLFY